MYFLELMIGYMGIDLGGGYRRMPKHGLDTPDISSIRQKISSKTVAKSVRMDIFYYSSLICIILYYPLYASLGNSDVFFF